MPYPKIYEVEEQAIKMAPEVERLDGTLKAAQIYVDKITRSAWWKGTCQPSWIGVSDLSASESSGRKAIPTKVLVRKGFPLEKDTLAWIDHLTTHEFRGKRYPVMYLSVERTTHGIPAIADKWTILHELAHIMTFDTVGHHHPEFNRALLRLIDRYLGTEQAQQLQACMWVHNLRGRRY